MSNIHTVDNFHFLLHRMSVEFLTERLGIEPTQQEINEFVAYVRDLSKQHQQKQQDGVQYVLDNVVEL